MLASSWGWPGPLKWKSTTFTETHLEPFITEILPVSKLLSKWPCFLSVDLVLTLLYAGPCYHNTPLHTYYYHFNRNGSKELKIWWQFSIDSFCRLYQVYFHNSLLKIFEIWHGSKLVSLNIAQKEENSILSISYITNHTFWFWIWILNEKCVLLRYIVLM